MVTTLKENLKLEALILESIPVGQDKSIRMRDLQKRIGINERVIRDSIEDLRRQGYLIATIGNGYYIPQDYKEAMDFKLYMRSRIINECVTLSHFTKSAKLRELKAVQVPMGI